MNENEYKMSQNERFILNSNVASDFIKLAFKDEEVSNNKAFRDSRAQIHIRV